MSLNSSLWGKSNIPNAILHISLDTFIISVLVAFCQSEGIEEVLLFPGIETNP